MSDNIELLTGGADKTIKIWSFEIDTQLQLVESERQEVDDEVTDVKFSPDGKLVCYSLLNNQIKVLYRDTLREFLSLYGHHLPVLSFDISSDSTLLVSASADKNVKLWGLDYGDCHKSIFAFDD